MIIKSGKCSHNKLIIGRPKRSMPQKETSVYLDLQILCSRKNILESNLKVLMSKVESLNYEIGKINGQMNELESCIKIRLCGDIKDEKERFKPEKRTRPGPLNKASEDDVRIVDFQY